MNCFLKIGETDVSDLVAGLKLSYQTLFGNEATNAQGRRVMDVIEGKRVSLTCTTKPLTQEEMERLLEAVDTPVVSVTYLDSRMRTTEVAHIRIPPECHTISCSVSAPEPEFYRLLDKNHIRYQPLELTFTEL